MKTVLLDSTTAPRGRIDSAMQSFHRFFRPALRGQRRLECAMDCIEVSSEEEETDYWPEEPVVDSLEEGMVIGAVLPSAPAGALNTVFRALALVRFHCAATRFHLLAEGGYHGRQAASDLLAGLSEWGLAAVTSVSFPTQVDEDEMQMLEIFVHPDMDSDFAGQWIAKAMRAGKPVVACNEQRESEWVIDRETGILVPVNEVNSLANALCWMLYHPQLALAMGMAGRKRVLEFEH